MKESLVQRAFDGFAVDVAVRQMRVCVGADVARRVEATANVKNRDARLTRFAALNVPFLDFVSACKPDPVPCVVRFQMTSCLVPDAPMLEVGGDARKFII